MVDRLTSIGDEKQQDNNHSRASLLLLHMHHTFHDYIAFSTSLVQQLDDAFLLLHLHDSLEELSVLEFSEIMVDNFHINIISYHQ